MNQSTATRRKSKSTPAANGQPALEPALDQVVRIPLAQLRNHPANPEPTPEEVRETAVWLRERGQDEPIVVRPVADLAGHYEVLAGKRRFAAAELLGWEVLQCRIRRDLEKDLDAVAFMAASNAQRHTESPIRQALMIEAMFARGYTYKQCGAIYGLESESAVRNKLQLLKLPDVWQRRVVSGEVPETAARCLVPYCDHSRLMDSIEKEYVDAAKNGDYRAERWKTRDGFENQVDTVVRSSVRPVQPGQTHNYGYELGWNHGCLIKLTPALEQELQVVELPLAANGTKVRVAINTERYDLLQVPLIKAKLAKKAGRSTEDKTAARDKPRTAAEEKALAKKHAEQLAKRIARWRHEWLREMIAAKLRQKVPDHWVLTKIVLWCFSQPFSYHAHGQLDFAALIFESAGGKSECLLHSEILPSLTQGACTLSTLQDVIAKALVIPEGNPDYPVWPHEFVDTLASDLAIDLADAWLVLQSSGRHPERVTSFWELHSGAQLDELGDELRVGLRAVKGKAAKINVLTGVARTLPLPKSIDPIGGKKRKAK